MSSGDDSDPNDVSGETHFVYQSGDEDVLWAVQEITAERGNKYRVKWVGIDPATGKPWAQSWVPKRDCTDDLVVEWKKRKKRGKRTRAGSKRAGSSTTSGRTRRSTSKAIPARAEEDVKPKTSKRKRVEDRVAAGTRTGTGTRDGDKDEDEDGEVEQEEREEPRPRKKQRTMVDVDALLPPVSSDEEELVVPGRSGGATGKSDGKRGDSGGASSKDGHEGKSGSRPRGTARMTEIRVPPLRTKAKVARLKERMHVVESEGEDEAPRSRSKPQSKRKSPSEEKDDLSEEAEATRPIKIGPPRGAKRQQTSKKSAQASKPGTSRTKPPKDDPPNERVSAEASDRPFSSFGSPGLLREQVDNHAPSPPRISIPQGPPNRGHHSPVLSPGAVARLELFDRIMAEPSQPDAPPDAGNAANDFRFDDIHDDGAGFDTFDAFESPPPLLSPPRSKSKPDQLKPSTPNGLIVPETESSGNSQSQSQSQLPKLPPPLPAPKEPSPRKPIDLLAIAVIAASTTSPSVSPHDLVPPRMFPPPAKSKRPTFTVPNTFRPANNARARVADPDPPPSSIESFTSPTRVDKGKQKAVEEDQLQSSLSEREDDARPKAQTQNKLTDSHLKKRGKELFDQAQLAREAEWQKNKNPKRLKAIDDIVNGRTSSPLKGSPFPSTSAPENALELQFQEAPEEVIGWANSATLDTVEHSEAKPLTKEEMDRRRFELREEEEESTQEALGIYSVPPVNEPKVTRDEDSEMPPPSSPNPKNSLPSNGRVEDTNHVEQPSTDLLLASVIVQASQDPRHEDTDMDPAPSNEPTSSPPRPVPENLTDSPKRRLGEALSLLNVKSEEIQRLERELDNEHKNLQVLKAELAELQQSSEPTGPVRAAWEAERAQWAQECSKWENDLSAWETQRKKMSQEKEGLSARLVELSDVAVRAEEAKVKLSELEAERLAWTKERDAMRNDMAQRSEEMAVLTKLRGEYDEERTKWEEERRLWAEEKAKWETERAALEETQKSQSHSVDDLTASAESITAAKASAEKDRDFFRDQYLQASAFVSSIRDENVELEKRAKIAEGQAREGVAGIKALFEGRVKALRADIDRWRGLTELLQEKDRRTNDELRLRAAQAPELIELCNKLNTENKSLEADIRRLSQTQQRGVYQRNKLFYEILLLKKERASLRSKLSKRKKKTEASINTQETSLSTPSLPQDPESIDPNDMETLPEPTQSFDTSFDEPALFPCMWRPQWRDQCQHVFDTKEDLERHMQDHFHDLLAQ